MSGVVASEADDEFVEKVGPQAFAATPSAPVFRLAKTRCIHGRTICAALLSLQGSDAVPIGGRDTSPQSQTLSGNFDLGITVAARASARQPNTQRTLS